MVAHPNLIRSLPGFESVLAPTPSESSEEARIPFPLDSHGREMFVFWVVDVICVFVFLRAFWCVMSRICLFGRPVAMASPPNFLIPTDWSRRCVFNCRQADLHQSAGLPGKASAATSGCSWRLPPGPRHS